MANYLTFCPAYFGKRYSNDLGSAGRTTSLNKLVSYEHLMAHEYMHVGMLGHCEAIVGVSTALLPSNSGAFAHVYGASRCKEWAWLNIPARNDPTGYNTKASINRNNYAWYATSEFFSYKWGKKTTKKERRQLFDDSNQADYATFTIDPESGTDVTPTAPG